LTRLVCGDDRPKQFCPLVGNDTLLEQTRRRTELSIPRDQILFPLTRSHRFFYLQESGIRPSQRLIQPTNRGTAPSIVYSLLSIQQQNPEAIVAVLPCDHHYSDEQTFTTALETAFHIAGQCPDSMVLLGAPPLGPHVEYGWIELGPSADGMPDEALQVRALFEQPSFHVARQLFERGALWNTFVMVGHVRAILETADLALRGMVETIRKSSLWAGSEIHIQDSLYERIDHVDFSQGVLSLHTRRLIALRLGAIGWNDLERPERVMAALEGAGLYPSWMRQWKRAEVAVAGSHSQAAVA